MSKKFPSFSQWKQVFKVLKKQERAALFVFIALAIVSLSFLTISFYFSNTNIVPAFAGNFTEGVVGQPRFINPIYGETNDIDRTLIALVFSGLMTYDANGQLDKDLAQDYSISNDARTYEFTLKPNLTWHDGKPLTADDIIFTIKTIQNSDYKSPLRANWIDVEVQKISDTQVRFILKTAYNSFLENATVKIIPKHIFENISPENFALSSYNLQPIGSGPFSFENLAQTASGFITKIKLNSNRKYYNQPSHISSVSFAFFEKKEDLIKAVNTGTIDGLTLSAFDNNQAQAEKEMPKNWQRTNAFTVYSFSMPRYVSAFFNNQKASPFADTNLRKAFSYATDTTDLLQVLNSESKNTITPVNSPILPDFYGYQPPTSPYVFNIDTAKSLLDKSGFKLNTSGMREKEVKKQPAFTFKSYLKLKSKGNEVAQLQSCLAKLDDNFKTLLKSETNGTYGIGTENAVTEFQKKYLPEAKPTGETGAGTRKKLTELCVPPTQNSQALKFTIVTVNQPQLLQTANLLKKYWQAVGAEVDINAVSLTDLKPIIKNRKYDVLLYGEALGASPDLYPFWHSSQKVDPGLNLSEYENKDVDKLLKESRETLDETLKEQKLEKLQNTILADAPALFLYNPNYIYWVAQNVQGVDTTKIIDPAKRFSNITNWFLQTKRVWN